MTQEEIDDMICEIMTHDGPDGHVDGHDKITEFIMALLSGNAEKWKQEYLSSKI